MKHLLGVLMFFIFSLNISFASESVGTILPSYKFSKICQDVSCTNFGIVNFAPTLNAMTPGAAAVTITDTAITGHLWGNQIGWINLAPSGLTSAQRLKVNPTTGSVTGLGFANTGSWVNFSPTSGGVTINTNGEFVGWAWVSGAYGGWMKFDCTSGATCVKTDWRPIPNRTVTTTITSGGSGAGVTGGCTTNCPVVITQTPTTPLIPLTNQTNSTKKSVTNSGVSTQKPSLNTFDTTGTGTATKGPETIVDTTKNIPSGIPSEVVNGLAVEGEYMQTFPKYSDTFLPEKNCFWCIVVRRDFAPTQEIIIDKDGKPAAGGVVIQERRIIKYGFVPKKYEIRFPLSKIGAKAGVQTDPKADLDLTSTSITLVALAMLRKIALVLLFK